MMDIKTKRESEIESLAMMLRKNKLASSDSEARRMAEEMLNTSKKVSDDFADREKKYFGEQRKDAEVELAHKQIEQLASNLARGKPDVRIDLEGIDVNKPLRELIPEDEEPSETEDEDAVELKEEPAEKAPDEVVEDEDLEKPELEEEIPEPDSDEDVPEPEAELEVPEPPRKKPFEEAEGDAGEPPFKEAPVEEALDVSLSEGLDDEVPFERIRAGDEKVPVRKSEEEREETSGEPAEKEDSEEVAEDEDLEKPELEEEAPEAEAEEEPSKEPSEEEPQGDSEDDFSVKELDTKEQLKKSEEERKKEKEKMAESKVNLHNVFNVNK